MRNENAKVYALTKNDRGVPSGRGRVRLNPDVNALDGFLVETTPGGTQIDTRLLDNTNSPPGNGALFGLAVAPHGAGVYYVDDAANTFNLLH